MTNYRVLLSKSAIKYLESLDKRTQGRIKSSLSELESDPFQPRPKADIKKLHKLSKHVLYRVRTGDYRAVYTVEGSEIKVANIFRRGKGYEWLD